MKNDIVVSEKPVKKHVVFSLSDQDLAERAKDMAQAEDTIRQLEEELREIQKDYAHKIGNQEQYRKSVARTVRNAKEIRLVDCQEVKDFLTRTIRYFYQGRLVEERKMHSDEIQQDLFEAKNA